MNFRPGNWLKAFVATSPFLLAAFMEAADQPPKVAQINAPPETKAAMMELWRRGECQLSAVYLPAEKRSPVPADIGATPVITPRLYNTKGAILCYAVNGQRIWAADDLALYEIDAASGKEIRRFAAREGLPGETVQSMVATGDMVWLATRGGLARLSVQAGTIAPVPEVQCLLGRLAAGSNGVWLIGDGGAYHLLPGEAKWKQLPLFPGQPELAGMARRGFWSALWRDKLQSALPQATATADGFHALCFDNLIRFDTSSGTWTTIARQASQFVPGQNAVWCLTTGGLLRSQPGEAKPTVYARGQGLAAGRPVGLAVTGQAVWVLSEPDYDAAAQRYVGGGISRFELAGNTWTVTEKVNEMDIRFATAIAAERNEVWVACSLYDKVEEFSAHPGMAHVKRWLPHRTGIGLLHYRAGAWTLLRGENLKTEKRWVLGQAGEVAADLLGPQSVERLCAAGERVWGEYRIAGEKYYGGYYISAGCLAETAASGPRSVFDVRSGELGLAGEQPELLLISLSHGEIVRGEGQPVILGMENPAGRVCVITESSVYFFDENSGKFQPAMREPFRAYWYVTTAVPGTDGAWFGGDAGTISRLDRATGRLDLVGVMKGRKITAMARTDDGIAVKTEKTEAVLPASLSDAPQLPAADVVAWDGKAWKTATLGVEPTPSEFQFEKDSSYLAKAGHRVAFIKGVFRPTVLCEDKAGGLLWFAAYNSIGAIPLP
jgi:hypothetical protein